MTKKMNSPMHLDRKVSVKFWGACVCTLTIVGLVSFLYISRPSLSTSSAFGDELGSSSRSGWTANKSCNNPPFLFSAHADDEDLVKSLINKLRERTRVAANGEPWEFTSEDAEKWAAKNPCQSRTEMTPLYSLRKFAKDLPLNHLWEEVFQEYTVYHRTCMRAVGNIADYFNSRNSTTGCQFMVADAGMSIGLGNKLLVIANSVFYGIITGRVILIPTSNFVPLFTCEPFVGSTWTLDSATFPTPPERYRDKWDLSRDVFTRVDKYKNSCNFGSTSGSDPNLPYGAGDTTNKKQPYQRFWCSTEQSFFSEITWTYMSGCLYTIPKTFATPTFRPTLEALFPDRVVLPRIFRSVILPADSVWTRVKRLHNTYLQPADRKVGIQMRYLHGKSHFDEVHELVDERVLQCVVQNGILPKVVKSGTEFARNSSQSSARIQVFVTSLYLSLKDKMTRMYMVDPTETGETVNLIQLTHDGSQEFGVDVDIQAYTEVLLLSLSDDLLLAPISTFGGAAQGYGALTPWFVEYRKEPEGLAACARGLTVELCGQYTPLNFECKYDNELGSKPFSDVVPFIQDCPQIEFPFLSEKEQGIQLRTSFMS